MGNSRQLLAAIAALILLLSAVSIANPNYLAGYRALADEDDNENENYADDDDKDTTDDRESDSEIVATFGEGSKVALEISDRIADRESANAVMAELEVEAEKGDLDDGEYDISFSCDSPDVKESFDESLVVRNGQGDFETELALVNGTTYAGCEVGIGNHNAASLPQFTIHVGVQEKEDREDEKDDDDVRDDHDDEDDEEKDDREEHEKRTDMDVKREGAEFKVQIRGVNMTDGKYDAIFACDRPELNMTLEHSFEVEDGAGKFTGDLALENGTYSGCELTVERTVVASFDSFVVNGHHDDVEEKRKEKRKEIVSKIDSRELHKRRMNANPASVGDYMPDSNYTLTLNGTAEQRAGAGSEEAEVDGTIELAVWKSNGAVILLSVLDGEVEVGNETYTIELGFALYSIQHGVMRIGAFVSDESGNILKLRLRGSATDVNATLPADDGQSIELVFEGNSGPARNMLDKHSALKLEGTLKST